VRERLFREREVEQVNRSAEGGSEWPEAGKLAKKVAEFGAPTVKAVLLYGSHLHKTGPDPNSALDFVVVVENYRAFYEGMASRSALSRPVCVMTWMADRLPPNVIAFAPNEGKGRIAKCLVISKDHFAAALGSRLPDHFVLGRMIQRIGYLWSRLPEDELWVREQIESAHSRVLEWMAPYLDKSEESFDGVVLGRRVLEVCYQGEFRPESQGHAARIFQAQAPHFEKALLPALESALTSGTLVQTSPGSYSLAEPVSLAEKRRWKRYFRLSKTRSTLRWLKHSVTFAHWLPYVVRKAERHTGRTIRLTRLERAVPHIFCWPRAIYILASRSRKEAGK
jgi:hypothetical protein